jgi:hypothetical protein
MRTAVHLLRPGTSTPLTGGDIQLFEKGGTVLVKSKANNVYRNRKRARRRESARGVPYL